MASPFSLRTRLGTTAVLALLGFGLLPGACGGSADIVFVGMGGGGGSGLGGLDGLGAQGGAPASGGTGTGTGGGSGGTILASCGDEEVDAGEDCDQGGDTLECDADCTDVECGDSHTNEATEACDSGGVDSAECNADCTRAVCGDFYTNRAADEECDGGTDGTDPGCDTDCTRPECGDGLVHAPTGERCDDGNSDDGDGCTAECVPEILILGDGVSEADAVEVLERAGFAVTLAPVLEYEFDGTNPVLDEFCGVIQFNATYTSAMLPAGQEALVDYVEAGGAFMSTGGSALEATTADLSAMSDLLLIEYVAGTEGIYAVTTAGATHAITTGLPVSFSHSGGGETGTCKAGSVSLLSDDVNQALCVDEEVGDGRAISLGNTFGFFDRRPLLDYEMETLLVNAANWMCGTSHPGPSAPITVGSTAVASHFGYQARCDAWNGSVCTAPYLAMNEEHVTGPDPHCIDDTTSLRPVWDYTQPATASTWCWIATGDSTVVATATSADPTSSGSWMYVWDTDGELCDDSYGRHPSTVDIPVVGAQIWSFDDASYVRSGYFMNVTCNWPTP